MHLKFTLQEGLEQLFLSTFICGAKQIGKTNHAMNIARTLMEGGVILFIIDPTRKWKDNFQEIENTLTIKNAKLPSIDWDEHCILDTSGLNAKQQQNFMENFCLAIMDVAAKSSERGEDKKKIMIIIEECQTPIPSMCLRSKERGDTKRMLTHGRHFGLNFIAITQFPAETDEMVIKAADHRYFFHLDKKSDKKCAKDFIGDFANGLSKLELGECLHNYLNEVSRETTPKFGEPLRIPIVEEEFPELARAMRESPIKEEVNERKNSKNWGKRYLFHMYPFGEAGSTVEPTLVKEIVNGLIKRINELNQSFDYIVCLGASDKWASHIGTKMNKCFRRIIERESHLPGEKHLCLDTILYAKDLYFRDFKEGDKVILIDDVISTGETSEEIIKTLNEIGVKVLGAFFIVAKGNGHIQLEKKFGVPFRYLKQGPILVLA